MHQLKIFFSNFVVAVAVVCSPKTYEIFPKFFLEQKFFFFCSPKIFEISNGPIILLLKNPSNPSNLL